MSRRRVGRRLVAGSSDTARCDGFREAAADSAQDKGGHFAFGRQGEAGRLRRKFQATVELKTCFAEEFSGETHVGRPINAPKPELLLMALEKIEGFLELLHGAIEGGGQEKDAQGPGVARVPSVDTYAILPVLVAFDAAAIVVADGRSTSGHRTPNPLRVKIDDVRCEPKGW